MQHQESSPVEEITVAGTPSGGPVIARTRELIEFAHHHGFGREEVVQIIQSLP